jgi:hypothetical protein
MKADKEQLAKIVYTLAHILLRPGMYVSEESSALSNFLNGFSIACQALGFNIEKGRENTWTERGWQVGVRHPISQMQEKSMSNDDIIAEAVGMMILTILRTYEVSTDQVLKVHKGIRESTERLDVDLVNSDGEIPDPLYKQIEHTIKEIMSLNKDIDDLSTQAP